MFYEYLNPQAIVYSGLIHCMILLPHDDDDAMLAIVYNGLIHCMILVPHDGDDAMLATLFLHDYNG